MDKTILNDIKRLLEDGLDCNDWQCVQDALECLDELMEDEDISSDLPTNDNNGW